MKKQIGGGFIDVWYDINLTDEHLIELNVTTDTIDGIIMAFKKMDAPDFPVGIKNRDKQPKWYRDNPVLSTIRNNPKYFEEFKNIIKSINKTQDIGSIGGGGSGREQKIIGRKFGVSQETYKKYYLD
jgi:hypothetical protein